MRARIVLIPMLVVAAFVAGCSKDSGSGTPTPGPTTPPPNGIAELSVDEIMAKATEALGKVSSYRAKGEVLSEGVKTPIDYQSQGDDISVVFAVEGHQVNFVKIGNDVYLKGLEELLGPAVPPAAAALIKGKYVKLDTTKPQFAALAKSFETEELLTPEGTASKGETKTIDGTPAIGVVDSTDSSVLYIATVGEPLPLRVEFTDGSVITFTYNEAFTISAPSAAEVVDS